VAADTNQLRVSGTAMGGVGLIGCASSATGTCTLAAPTATAPALYQAGGTQGPPATGLQFTVPAVTGVKSLPLQVGTANAHTLASTTLQVTPTQAQLVNASLFWPTDTIDTALVSHGDLVAPISVSVGSG
jgi:hypothetical protein